MEHEENQSNSIRHPAVDEFAPEMMTRILGNILSYTIVQIYANLSAKILAVSTFFAPLSGCHPCLTGEDLREQTAGREAAMFGYFFQGHLRMFGY